jgi:hypothetical protein
VPVRHLADYPEMKPLATTFRKDGFDYRVIQKEAGIALLEQNKAHWSAPAYEVVIIQNRKAHTWPNGKSTEAHEAMPSSEDWGLYGFTYSDLTAAKAKFNSLVDNRPDRAPFSDTGPNGEL